MGRGVEGRIGDVVGKGTSAIGMEGKRCRVSEVSHRGSNGVYSVSDVIGWIGMRSGSILHVIKISAMGNKSVSGSVYSVSGSACLALGLRNVLNELNE